MALQHISELVTPHKMKSLKQRLTAQQIQECTLYLYEQVYRHNWNADQYHQGLALLAELDYNAPLSYGLKTARETVDTIIETVNQQNPFDSPEARAEARRVTGI